jgi:hypothetical protein
MADDSIQTAGASAPQDGGGTAAGTTADILRNQVLSQLATELGSLLTVLQSYPDPGPTVDTGAVRFDVVQSLLAAQQAQARTNINAQVAGNYQAALGFTPVNQDGDTITGNLVVNGTLAAGPAVGSAGDVSSCRAGSPGTGIIWLGNSAARYLFFDGVNYNLPGSHVIGAAGRLLGTTTDAGLIVSGRLVFAGDVTNPSVGLIEPIGGAVMTGFGKDGNGFLVGRFRLMQLEQMTGNFFTIGFA